MEQAARAGERALPELLGSERAVRLRQTGVEAASKGDPGRACLLLGWAAHCLARSGEPLEELKTRLLLAWAQDLDGRSWQSVRTMRWSRAQPDYPSLPAWIRSRAETSLSRALWATGDYTGAVAAALSARRLAAAEQDRAWAELAVGHALHYLGQADAAERAFRDAARLLPSMEATTRVIRAYLHNLRGEHRRALQVVEDELAILAIKPRASSLEELSRAAELAAIMVERCTAKAFLRHRDARQSVLDALNAVSGSHHATDLELARIHRAWAVTLAQAGERRAAEAYLHEAAKVFRLRRAQPEQDLLAVAVSIIGQDRRPERR